jgi:hypothetical protein
MSGVRAAWDIAVNACMVAAAAAAVALDAVLEYVLTKLDAAHGASMVAWSHTNAAISHC